MRAGLLVAQLHAVFLAGAAAIAVAGAVRKKAAEDAMLGMEDRKMLVRDGLDRLRALRRAPDRPLGPR